MDVLQVPAVLLLGGLGLLFLGERLAPALQQDLERASTADAFEPFVVLAGEVDVELAGQPLPCEVVVLGSVDEDSVQIEYGPSDRGDLNLSAALHHGAIA